MGNGLWLRDGVYYSNIVHPKTGEKIRKSLGTTNKRLAQNILEELKTSLRSGRPDILAEGPTLGEFIPRVLEEHYKGLKYYNDVKRHLGMLEKFAGKNRRLSEITKGLLSKYRAMRVTQKVPAPFRGPNANSEKIAAWEAKSQKLVQDSTINREITTFMGMLNRAVEWDVLGANPLTGLRKKSEKKNVRKRYLLKPELRAAFDAMEALKSELASDILRLAFHIGRRKGEMLRLRKENFDRGNGYVFFEFTKEGTPDWIPLPPKAQEILERRYKQTKCEWLFPKQDNTGPVACIQSAFKRVIRRTGIKNFRFHDIRHTTISYMVMAGVDFFTIAALVGHTTPRMIEERYGHLSPKHKEASAVIFGKYMERITGDVADNKLEVGNVRPIVQQVADFLSREEI